jgi:hypothetical protein
MPLAVQLYISEMFLFLYKLFSVHRTPPRRYSLSPPTHPPPPSGLSALSNTVSTKALRGAEKGGGGSARIRNRESQSLDEPFDQFQIKIEFGPLSFCPV